VAIRSLSISARSSATTAEVIMIGEIRDSEDPPIRWRFRAAQTGHPDHQHAARATTPWCGERGLKDLGVWTANSVHTRR
jgi:LmbE family N-acetylglucosaminyl deacetylase